MSHVVYRCKRRIITRLTVESDIMIGKDSRVSFITLYTNKYDIIFTAVYVCVSTDHFVHIPSIR